MALKQHGGVVVPVAHAGPWQLGHVQPEGPKPTPDTLQFRHPPRAWSRIHLIGTMIRYDAWAF